MPTPLHIPVMVDEVVHWLEPNSGATLVDGTTGGGGHTRRLAELVGPTGQIIAMDRDPIAVARAEENLKGMPIQLVESN
ncbi:MAG: 16S rRNA (cytosine(1402)-N(4))-methyltransferase, partial [Pirellulales bacterium]